MSSSWTTRRKRNCWHGEKSQSGVTPKGKNCRHPPPPYDLNMNELFTHAHIFEAYACLAFECVHIREYFFHHLNNLKLGYMDHDRRDLAAVVALERFRNGRPEWAGRSIEDLGHLSCSLMCRSCVCLAKGFGIVHLRARGPHATRRLQ